ncbi:hydrolase TatD [Alicyclobacillus hesperidum subsp. aegles]|uniref:TatD family hydrolase n=1 Tax=Alicyclobacillus hesperidum TaxID=89784 RepID=UPI00222944E9|nr:TatD family hydrolase [Alicyclobacillus hesperidum]GLG02423.1 hydrolase TatD [Alicyclobacillus hesperidum subsp. aegles]
MRLFDTHCHLMDGQFSDDLDEVIARAREEGVDRVVIPAVDLLTAHAAIRIAEAHEGIYAAVGIHPESAADVKSEVYDEIERLAKHEKVVAIGEIGLDYYWDHAPRPVQQEVMERQIEIAKRVGLPIIVHNRESTEDVITLIAKTQVGTSVGGVMHCFNEREEVLVQCLDLGMYISFAGPITFKKSDDLRALAAKVPPDRLLVETDSPYLSPHPFRGKRNEPARVKLVADTVAYARGESIQTCAEQTWENAHRLFWKVKR